MTHKESYFGKLLDKALSGDADADRLIRFYLSNEDDLCRRQKARREKRHVQEQKTQ